MAAQELGGLAFRRCAVRWHIVHLPSALMPPETSTLYLIGAGCFGAVVGWITHRTLRRAETTGLGDIATVIGAIGGAAVLAIFDEKVAFGVYGIGLFVGFVAYLILYFRIVGTKDAAADSGGILGAEYSPASASGGARQPVATDFHTPTPAE